MTSFANIAYNSTNKFQEWLNWCYQKAKRWHSSTCSCKIILNISLQSASFLPNIETARKWQRYSQRQSSSKSVIWCFIIHYLKSLSTFMVHLLKSLSTFIVHYLKSSTIIIHYLKLSTFILHHLKSFSTFIIHYLKSFSIFIIHYLKSSTFVIHHLKLLSTLERQKYKLFYAPYFLELLNFSVWVKLNFCTDLSVTVVCQFVIILLQCSRSPWNWVRYHTLEMHLLLLLTHTKNVSLCNDF